MRSATIAAIGVLVLASAHAWAQSATSGAVQGILRDQQGGAAVAGATVVAISPALLGSRATLSDAAGGYFLADLPPGLYTLSVYYGAGETRRGNVLVQLGKTARIDVALSSEAAKEIVGQVSLLDQGSAALGLSLGEDHAHNVPTRRTFAGAAGAAAGARRDPGGQDLTLVDGLPGTDLPGEFVPETEVVTAGFPAALGRATGAVVAALTRAGGNRWHGSVFSYVTAGALEAAAEPIARAAQTIERRDERRHLVEVGAEIGGPIVEDRIWLHAGVAPMLRWYRTERIIRDGSGAEVARTAFDLPARDLWFTGKLSVAAAPEQRGELAVSGNPGTAEWIDTVAAADPGRNQRLRLEWGAVDVVARWSSELAGGATRIDAALGDHRWRDRAIPLGAADSPSVGSLFGQLADFEEVPGCGDCPLLSYERGGVAVVDSRSGERLTGQAALGQQVRLAGRHRLQAGGEIASETDDRLHNLPGGIRYVQSGAVLQAYRIFVPSDGGGDLRPCGLGTCRWVGPEGVTARARSLYLAAFAQDFWSPRPDLTVEAGVRWERQALFTPEHLHGVISPATGEPFPDQAFALTDLVAPRVGVVYDWTDEGRARLFAHVARYYESVPLDLIHRAFSGEVGALDFLSCADPDPRTCDPDVFAVSSTLTGGGVTPVASDLGGPYTDEAMAGVEYEVIPGLAVGAAYLRRRLGRVIQELSTDEGATFFVGNPGESDPAGRFDGPARRHDALQFTLAQRFARGLYLLGAYTVSRSAGNYAGETAQAEPQPNRYGALPDERRNRLAVDGYAVRGLGGGRLVVGASFRAASGAPTDVRGGDYDTLLLPRGTGPRLPALTTVDVHLAYGRALREGTTLEAFVDVFNLFDRQAPTALDEIYSASPFDRPIAGGDEQDLVYLPTDSPSGRNPTFGRITARQPPLAARLGLRLEF